MTADGLDLRSLGDDDLVQQMHADLYDGMKVEIVEAVHILLERAWSPYRTLTGGLVESMRIVGVDFRDGILFVPMMSPVFNHAWTTAEEVRAMMRDVRDRLATIATYGEMQAQVGGQT